MTRIILLPGLDGTARLFKRFIEAVPPNLAVTAFPLPAYGATYEDLADSVTNDVGEGPAPVLIAESFSGPLALMVAQRCRLAGLVLCNTFVSPPRSRAFRWVAFPLVFRLPLPSVLVRRDLVGEGADAELVKEVVETVGSVPATELASRVRMVLESEAANEFEACTVPVLYLRGTEDRLVPDTAWRRMVGIKPMAVVQIPGPHFLLQANPRGAWEAISPFIQSLPAV